MQATLIGDVVGSRRVDSRGELQQRLLAVLEDVGRRVGSPLRITLGDEFQGRFPGVRQALAASWYLHVAMIGMAPLRIGIGWGEIVVEPEEGTELGQDGPAWWAARDAIEELAGMSQGGRTLVATGTDWEPMINHYLTLRDLHIASWDETDAAIALGLGEGLTQRAISQDLGIHESSVSRRARRRHLAEIVAAATPDLPELW